MAYTLVQHTGFTIGRDPTFYKAVEESYLSSRAAEKRVTKAGGLLFADYSKASEAALAANYPPEVHGFVPCVRGAFRAVAGMRLYMPADDDPARA